MTDPFTAPNNTVIVKSTIPVKILCHAKAATIAPRMIVESAADGDADDRLEIIYGSANSKIIRGTALYDELNAETLSENNATVTKATTFAIGDGIQVGTRIPIVEHILGTRQGTLTPGQRLIAGATGFVIAHPDNLALSAGSMTDGLSTVITGIPLDATVAILLSLVATVDATQVVQTMPLW